MKLGAFPRCRVTLAVEPESSWGGQWWERFPGLLSWAVRLESNLRREGDITAGVSPEHKFIMLLASKVGRETRILKPSSYSLCRHSAFLSSNKSICVSPSTPWAPVLTEKCLVTLRNRRKHEVTDSTEHSHL